MGGGWVGGKQILKGLLAPNSSLDEIMFLVTLNWKGITPIVFVPQVKCSNLALIKEIKRKTKLAELSITNLCSFLSYFNCQGLSPNNKLSVKINTKKTVLCTLNKIYGEFF